MKERFWQHIDVWTKWPPFSYDIFKSIYFNENVEGLIQQFFPTGPINNDLLLD